MRKKKILILSYDLKGHSNIRLKEEIEKKDFECEIKKPTDFYPYISKNSKGYDRIYERSEEKSKKLIAKEYAAIIPRFTDERSWEFSIMILRHFNENLNVFSTGSVYGLEICVNKFYNAQFMSINKIPVPDQVLSHKPTDYKELTDLVGGLPSIGKLQQGSQGNGVFILNDELAASTALRSMERGGEIVLQRFVDTGKIKNDIRAVCVGAGTAEPKIYAYKRFALDDDFRSNYSLSSKGQEVKLTKDEKEMILNVSKKLQLGVVGVDIMRDSNDNDKPYIIETNHAPGLKGVETVTGENVAEKIVDYIIDNHIKGGNRYSMDFLHSLALTYLNPLNTVILPHIYNFSTFEKALKSLDFESKHFEILSYENNEVTLRYDSIERLHALGYQHGVMVGSS